MKYLHGSRCIIFIWNYHRQRLPISSQVIRGYEFSFSIHLSYVIHVFSVRDWGNDLWKNVARYQINFVHKIVNTTHFYHPPILICWPIYERYIKRVTMVTVISILCPSRKHGSIPYMARLYIADHQPWGYRARCIFVQNKYIILPKMCQLPRGEVMGNTLPDTGIGLDDRR